MLVELNLNSIRPKTNNQFFKVHWSKLKSKLYAKFFASTQFTGKGRRGSYWGGGGEIQETHDFIVSVTTLNQTWSNEDNTDLDFSGKLQKALSLLVGSRDAGSEWSRSLMTRVYIPVSSTVFSYSDGNSMSWTQVKTESRSIPCIQSPFHYTTSLATTSYLCK